MHVSPATHRFQEGMCANAMSRDAVAPQLTPPVEKHLKRQLGKRSAFKTLLLVHRRYLQAQRSPLSAQRITEILGETHSLTYLHQIMDSLRRAMTLTYQHTLNIFTLHFRCSIDPLRLARALSR